MALGILALLGLVGVALWRWRRRRHQQHHLQTKHDTGYVKAELPGTGVTHLPLGAADAAAAELDNGPRSSGPPLLPQVDGTHARAELDGGWRGWEAPAQYGLR